MVYNTKYKHTFDSETGLEETHCTFFCTSDLVGYIYQETQRKHSHRLQPQTTATETHKTGRRPGSQSAGQTEGQAAGGQTTAVQEVQRYEGIFSERRIYGLCERRLYVVCIRE